MNLLSFLGRKPGNDDPFAPERESWVEYLLIFLALAITGIVGIAGFITFIGSFVRGFSMWIGLSLMIATIPMSVLVAYGIKLADDRHRGRVIARAQRRELLLVNRLSRRMPTVSSPRLHPEDRDAETAPMMEEEGQDLSTMDLR